MDILSKIRLSWRFGKVSYLISAVISVTMAVVVAFTPSLIPACILIKAISTPVINYLNKEMTKGMGIYFYLNLGISRKEYFFLPFIAESILFIFLITITGTINYVIR